MPLTLVQVARIPAEGVASFQRFEAHVLPLLAKHGGAIERRLRGDAGRLEVHVLSFPSRDALQAYLDDPGRTQHLPLRDASGATFELFEVEDVGAGL